MLLSKGARVAVGTADIGGSFTPAPVEPVPPPVPQLVQPEQSPVVAVPTPPAATDGGNIDDFTFGGGPALSSSRGLSHIGVRSLLEAGSDNLTAEPTAPEPQLFTDEPVQVRS